MGKSFLSEFPRIWTNDANNRLPSRQKLRAQIRKTNRRVLT